MAWLLVFALMATALRTAPAQAQQDQPRIPPPVPPVTIIQPGTGSMPTIVVGPQTPAEQRDRCGPLNSSISPDRCDALLSPTRDIRIVPGTQKTLRFDRPYRGIQVDDPNDAIRLRAEPDNTTAII